MTTRTPTQNNAMWLYLTRLAEALDGAGYDLQAVVSFSIKPTKDNLKVEVWNRVQKALFPEIDSSKELETTQVSEVYDVINANTAQRFGVSVPFPSQEELSNV